MRIESPQGAQDGLTLLFGDERATKAALSFLRKTKVGQRVTVPSRDEEKEEGRGKGRRGGQHPQRTLIMERPGEGRLQELCFFWRFGSVFFLFLSLG